MSGVQMIELHTDQPDAFERLLVRWQQSPERSPRVCRDRFDVGHFVLLIDEPDAPALLDGCDDEVTTRDWAAALIDLLDSRPRFLDLDSVPPPAPAPVPRFVDPGFAVPPRSGAPEAVTLRTLPDASEALVGPSGRRADPVQPVG